MPLSPDQRERVLSIFRRFLAQRLANLDKLSLDKLTFNVIALRASAALYELTDPDSLLKIE